MENKTLDVQPKCQGPLQLLSPPFLMTSTTKHVAKRKGGGKYWQPNQSNEHASNYSRIKQRQRMRWYILNIHKNLG